MVKKIISFVLVLCMLSSFIPASVFAAGNNGGETKATTGEQPETVLIAAEGFESGDGSRNTPYVIRTPQQLSYLASSALKGETYDGKYLSVAADIDMSDFNWVPIPDFRGTLYGNNFTISNLTVKNSSSITVKDGLYNIGFIGINRGSVEYLNFLNINVNITYANVVCGAVAGYNRGTVYDCDVSGTVKVNASASGVVYVGGITGVNQKNAGVFNSRSTAAVSGTSSASDVYAGGIAGNNNGSITACSTSGDILANAKPGYAGGLAGRQHQGWTENSYSTANVTAQASTGVPAAGGLVGMAGTEGNTIVYSYYAGGTVTAKATGDNYDAHSGGLIGTTSSCTVKSSFASGKVVATTKYEKTTSDSKGDQLTGKGYAGYIIGYSGGTGAKTVTGSYYASNMSLQRTTTESHSWEVPDGCGTKTEYGYRHGTATTSSFAFGTATTEANFKTKSFITGTLQWSAYSTLSNASPYYNAWLVSGNYPKLYTEYVYNVAFVNYVVDKVRTVDFRQYEPGYNFSYAVKLLTGHTPDKNSIQDTANGHKVYSVVYTPNKHNLTISYFSSKDTTKELMPKYDRVYSYGDAYNAAIDSDLVPEIIGYTVQAGYSQLSGYMLDSDIHYNVYYDPNPCTITVKYVKKDGSEAAPSVQYDCFYDETYSIVSPVVEGYTANQTTVSGTAKGDKEITVTYGVNPYTVTVHHLYDDGTKAAEPEVFNCAYGDQYAYFPKEFEGYTPNKYFYSGTVGAQNITLTFVYTLKYYNLTITYVDGNGNTMASAYSADLAHGTNYSIPSPVIDGYQVSPAFVSGVLKGNKSVTVNYNLNPHTLRINFYDGDSVIAVYEQEHDYTSSYSINPLDYVPAKYAQFYDFADSSQSTVFGVMPDEDVSIDVHFVRSVIDSGTCGEDITWTLYKDGELHFDAPSNGAMNDYAHGLAPWYEHRDKIKTVTIDGNLSKIGRYAFADCKYLTDTQWLTNVTKISEFAFWGCYGIMEVDIPANVAEIADGAFANMDNIRFVVDSDNPNYTSTNDWLYNKSGTKLLAYPVGWNKMSITIGESVTEIGAYAFYGLYFLENLTLNQKLEKVGEYAFYGCSIETLIFEGTVHTIGTKAFACNTLKTVYCKGDVPTTLGQDVFGAAAESDVYVYYPVENTTWKAKITTNIVDNYKYYYWNGYRAYGISDMADISLGNLGTQNLYAFRILYKNDATPIADVSVTFNNVTKKTDADGFVYFVMSEELTWTYLTLAKDGYNSIYDSPYRYALKEIGIDYLTLTDVSSVHGVTCNGDNISNGKAYINTKYSGEAKIIVQGSSTLEIAKMLVVQNGTTLGSSTDIRDGGRCTITVKNGAFQKDAGEVYVYMLVKDDDQIRHAATATLNLTLIAYDMHEAELLSSFTSALGDTFNGLTIPIDGTGIPFLDGTKIKLTPPEFKGKAEALQKIAVECDNNKIFVTYNLDGDGKSLSADTKQMQQDSYKDYVIDKFGNDWYESFCKDNKYVDKNGNIDDSAALKNITMQDGNGKMLTLDDFEISSDRKQKDFMSKVATKTNDFLENRKGIKKADTQGKFSFDVELAGGFVVTFDENGHDIDPIVQISVQLKSSLSTQFVIAVINVPVVIDVTAKAEGAVTFTEFHLDLAKQQIEFPDYVKVDVGGSITVSVGIGTRCISVGVFGRITLETSVQIGGGDVYFDGLYLTGAVGLYAQAKILGFSVRWEKSWELFEWCAIQPRNVSYANVMMASAYDLSAYTLGASIRSIDDVKWTSDNTVDVVDDAYAYSNAKLAYVGEELIMVYLDIADDRNEYNASTLMYAVYDFENKTWGQSREVDDNRQSESDFELLVVGNALYIVYTESGREFADGEFTADDSQRAMMETAKTQEIAAVTYDSTLQQFVNYKVLTNDSYQDSTPVIGVTNGKPSVAWVKNTGDDETAVFGNNYSNEIYISYYDNGNWGTPEALLYGCGMVVDMAVGEIDDPTVAFVVDLDSDLYTDKDRSLYIYNLNSNAVEFHEKYNTYVSNLQYAQLDGQKMLTWFENYNIAYTVDGEQVDHLLEKAVETMDSAYKLVEVAEGIYALIWAVPQNDSSMVYAMFRTPDGTWGDPISLFKTSYYQMSMDAVSVHGDLKFVVSSTQMNQESSELQMYSKIGFMSMTTGYGMEVDDVKLTVDTANSVMNLEATIANTSIKEIQNIAIYIQEYKPDMKIYQYHIGGIYSVNLTAGESDDFVFSCDYVDSISDIINCSVKIEIFEGTLEELEKSIADMNKKEMDSYVSSDGSSSGNIYVQSTVTGNYGSSIVGGLVHVGSHGIATGKPSLGGNETQIDPRYDLQVEGEYIIIGSTEYLSVKVTNKGNVNSTATLRITQADTNEVVYEAHITDICQNGTKYYLVKLNKEYFEATDATFVCTLTFEADEFPEDNQCDIVAYKVENAAFVPYDKLATDVDMSTHNATFDKNGAEDIEVDITLNGNEFEGIQNVESGKYTTTPVGDGVIKAIISGVYLKDWEDGEYQLEFLFKTENSWINSYLNLFVTDTTPIDLKGAIQILGTPLRGNTLTVDVSKLTELYDITYQWYVNDVPVSTEATYRATEADLYGTLRVEVVATGLIEGRLTEEYLITEIGEYIVDISAMEASLQYKWFVDGQVVSEDSVYTVTTADVGKSIYVEVYGNGEYDGTITSSVHFIPKVERQVGAPVLEAVFDGTRVILGNLFLYGDGQLYYGYSLTNDPTTVENWQTGRTFTLPGDGYYYFFAMAAEGDVYALTYSAPMTYAYKVSKVVWSVDGTVTEELYTDGENPVFKGSVEKPNSASGSYRFVGWDCNGDQIADFTATDVLPAVNSQTVTYVAVYEMTPIVVNTALNVKGSTLSIQSDISINYYISAAELSQYDSFYVEFTKDYYNNDGTVSQIITVITDYTVSGSYYVFSYNGIAAKEMKDEIRAVVYAMKDGTIYCSQVDKYSVAKYAYNRVNSSSNAQMVELAVSLLNYGAAAQTYFGYNVENLANSQLSAAQQAKADEEITLSSVKKYITPDNALVLFTGASLSLEDKVAINYYFNMNPYLNAGYSLDDLSLVIKYGDNVEVVDATKFGLSANGYYVSFDKLAAKDMKTVCEATFWVHYGSDAKEIIGETMVYSIESYAQSKQNSSDMALRRMIRAMMHYGEAAYSYSVGS